MISQFLNTNNLTAEVELWKSFTNRLDSERDKELFKKMLTEYCNYIGIIVNANKQYFPSEPLVIALILSQHKKMINWLMNKVSEHNTNLSNYQSIEMGKGLLDNVSVQRNIFKIEIIFLIVP